MGALLIAVGLASLYKIRQSNRELDQARIEQSALERQIADARKESVALWSQRRLQARRTTTGEAIIDLWLPAPACQWRLHSRTQRD